MPPWGRDRRSPDLSLPTTDAGRGQTALVVVLLAGWIVALVASVRSPTPWMPNSWALGLGLLVAWQCGVGWGLGVRLACEAVRWSLLPQEHWTGDALTQTGLSLLAAGLLIVWVDRRRRGWQRAHALSRLDPLTQLPNRQALEERLTAELSRARRFQRPFALFAVDCDGFKQINDRLGHAAGDEALRHVARALRLAVRQYDTVARYGGDEFLLLLPETDLPDAESVAERLHASLAHAVRAAYPGLTASLGVVVFRDSPPSGEECLRLADAAMYRAKQGGKNRTEFDVWESPDDGAMSRQVPAAPSERLSAENWSRISGDDVAG
jgi:diguanylate cyclase (GGDEF)-like protein